MDEQQRYQDLMAQVEASKVVILLTTPEQVAQRDRVRTKLRARQAEMRRDRDKR